jgi:TPR repeat protein
LQELPEPFLAGEAGNMQGQRNLEHAFAQGQGTSVDVVEAYQWLSVAVKQGDKAAKEELADLTKKLSQEQLRQGQERAAAFSRQSASEPALVR